ncbi:single-stranded DNA-binding protein [Ornithinimicrobium ciconiae]|uniref:Single-stranded DNA-binding protein n=1 Tax=Ornithinimicrobium ciconiae TaxID=2594265 RepID=A0A516GCZ5_9MICO|nr:single-stranded DNA-binding protein [Ornithinimicrobium ciconiae]QDO89399.1 single-stranded DNA-binding protein [Ornithinimicrobium ciconiae]
MTDSLVTVAGNVTAEPVVGTTKGGDVFSSFRVAVNHGYFDRERQVWLETGTSFYKVSAFRALAVNAFESLKKGTPVIVQGKLRVVNWTNGDKQGTEAQIMATEIGPNLNFGQADFTSVRRPQLSGTDPLADENVRAALDGPPADDAPSLQSDLADDAEDDYAEESTADEQVPLSA